MLPQTQFFEVKNGCMYKMSYMFGRLPIFCGSKTHCFATVVALDCMTPTLGRFPLVSLIFTNTDTKLSPAALDGGRAPGPVQWHTLDRHRRRCLCPRGGAELFAKQQTTVIIYTHTKILAHTTHNSPSVYPLCQARFYIFFLLSKSYQAKKFDQFS